MTRPFVTSLESAYLGQANAVRQEEYILGCVLQKGEVTRSSRRNGTLGATVLAGGCYGAAAPLAPRSPAEAHRRPGGQRNARAKLAPPGTARVRASSPSRLFPHSEAPMLSGLGLVLWGVVPVLTPSVLPPGRSQPSPAPRCCAGWGRLAWAVAGHGSFPVHAHSYGSPIARHSPGGPSAPPRELRAP